MEKIKLSDFLLKDIQELNGKVICFPTDTVYGVGAIYNDQVAIDKIYRMKKRSKDKPLVNLCSRISQITNLGIIIKPEVQSLIENYWPGALTIIFKDGDKTTSFRMPDSPIALTIIEKFSMMATTSVNESGEPELNNYEDIAAKFADDIDYFISDPAVFSKIPSTVIDVSKDLIQVLRLGNIKIY